MSETKNGEEYIEYKFNINFSKADEWNIGIEIGDVIKMLDNKATFAGEVNFTYAKFYEWARFRHVTFSGEVNFGHARFYEWAVFHHARFSEIVSFWQARFSGGVSFGVATFSEWASFIDTEISELASFHFATFEKVLDLTGIFFNINRSAEIFIDLSDCTVKNKILFSYYYEKDNGYINTILSLHNSNIAYFSCDDKELKNIKLYWKNPTREEDRKVEKKIKLEKYLHELRIMRKIFQDLNWGDVADDYYTRIIDTQLDIKRIDAVSGMWKRGIRVATIGGIVGFLLEKIVFQKVFGWGVRMRNAFLAVAVIIFCLFLLNSISWWLYVRTENLQTILTQSLAYTFQSFLALDVNIHKEGHMPDFFLILGIIEVAIGLVIYTVFVAILSRKFMRM